MEFECMSKMFRNRRTSMSKFKKFYDYENYTKIVGYRLGPTEEELDKIKAKTPTMRMCLDCKSPVEAFRDRCPYCKGINFKIIC